MASKMQILQAKLAHTNERMETVRATADVEGRELTEPEQIQLASSMSIQEGLLAQIRGEERVLAEQRKLPEMSPIWGGGPGLGGERVLGQDSPAEAMLGGRRPSIAGRGKKYASLFPECRLDLGGFRDAEDFLAAAGMKLSHPGLKILAAAGREGSGSLGGYAVPSLLSASWLDASLESEIVRPRASVYPMGSDTLKVPGWDNSDHSGGSVFGGITPVWLGEGTTMTEQIPTLRRIELKARKLACFAVSSNEVLADGLGYAVQVQGALTAGIGWGLDRAFLTGTGAGQPLGVLNDPALITITKEAGQMADTVSYFNLTKMFARLHPACMANAVWVINPTCIPQLLELSLDIGLGGAAIPVLSSPSGVWTILTRPVLFTEKVPKLGDAGDIGLYDFTQYAVGLRAELAVESSAHVKFTTDELAWRAIVRVDGQGTWNGAFTPLNGDTQSWCVALGAR